MWWIPFTKILKTFIKLVKNQIFKKVYIPLKPTWRSCFFTRTTQNKSRTTKYLAVEQRQDQHEVRHVWSIGVIPFVLIEIQMWTQVTSKYFTKKFPNKVDFPDVISIFPKIWCGLPSTLFLTGELWPLRFIWHHDLWVTHCQSSAMTFVFTQYSFRNSFRQGLKCILLYMVLTACISLYAFHSRHFTLSLSHYAF